MLYFALGLLSGILLAGLGGWYLVVKPLVNDIRLMRYKGFQPNFPKPERTEPVLVNPHRAIED